MSQTANFGTWQALIAYRNNKNNVSWSISNTYVNFEDIYTFNSALWMKIENALDVRLSFSYKPK